MSIFRQISPFARNWQEFAGVPGLPSTNINLDWLSKSFGQVFPLEKRFHFYFLFFMFIHSNQDLPSSFGKVWLFFCSVDSTSLVDSVEVNWGWLSNIRPHFFHEILSLFFIFQVSTDIYWVWLSKSFNKVRRNFFTWNSPLDSARRASTRFNSTKNAS